MVCDQAARFGLHLWRCHDSAVDGVWENGVEDALIAHRAGCLHEVDLLVGRFSGHGLPPVFDSDELVEFIEESRCKCREEGDEDQVSDHDERDH